MVYKLPIDLYKDWKDITFTKELFENIVKELKEQMKVGVMATNCSQLKLKVKHGYWKDLYGNKYDNHLYVCSECGGKALYKFVTNDLGQEEAVQELSVGCPHCLAKMDSQL